MNNSTVLGNGIATSWVTAGLFVKLEIAGERASRKSETTRDCIANLEINRTLNKIHEPLAIASWTQESIPAITGNRVACTGKLPIASKISRINRDRKINQLLSGICYVNIIFICNCCMHAPVSHQWRSLLKYSAASRKVAFSIPYGVILLWHNPSGRSMALGSTQPLI